ncbi:MAG TPA: hypothetical protein PLT82_05680 [Candidatus Hydrogenedens sp.]|nr:hypothetical protein [Candidatus Hydrogenedens sp.]HOK09326.1 hypothetical protein [Candidatus Hydrogenedens sp.]HOL19813.1 hypothetical protein [Candidatus Hydrogenedens sp.]HPP58604.1 hypothetical protein [Candidatus Hydrogenedens sp.]
MTIIALLLMILGFGFGIAVFMGILPESMSALTKQPLWIYFAVGIVGAVMAYLNRRPHD